MKYPLLLAAILFSSTLFSQTPRLVYPTGQTNESNKGDYSFSMDNAFFVTSSSDHFYIWNRPTGRLLYTFAKTRYSQVQVNPVGKTIISSYQGNVNVTDMRTGKQQIIHQAMPNLVTSVSNDGKYILTNAVRDSINLLTHPDGKFIQRIPGNFSKILFTADGKYVISMDGKRFFKWDLVNRKEIGSVDLSSYYIVSIRPYINYLISPAGDLVAAKSRDTVFVWQFGNDRPIKTISGNWANSTYFRFTDDGNVLMLISDDGTMTAWNVTSGKITKQYIYKPMSTDPWHAQFSPDGKIAVVLTRNNIMIYEAWNGRMLDSIHLNFPGIKDSHKELMRIVAFSPDSKQLAIDALHSIILYSVNDKQSVTLKTRYENLTSALFSPGNKYLLTNTEDTATLWETESWKPLVQMAMGRSNFECAFNDNATRLMMWDGRDIVLWSIPEGKKMSEIRNPFRGRISRPYISGDGSKIGLVSRNGIYIWDVITKKNISKVSRGFTYQWEELAFSYNGTYFIVAQKDSLLLMRADGTSAARMGRPAQYIGIPQFSKDDKYIQAGASIYDIAKGKWLETAEQAGKNVRPASIEQSRFEIVLNDTATSNESGVRIMEKSTGHFFQLIPLAGKNYIIYDGAGRYDGSAEALSQLTLACDDKIITDKKEIEKLYEPGLAEKIMMNLPVKAMKIAQLNICN